MKKSSITILALGIASILPATASPDIWKDLKGIGKEVVKGVGNEAKSQGGQILNSVLGNRQIKSNPAQSPSRSTNNTTAQPARKTQKKSSPYSQSTSKSGKTSVVPPAIGAGVIRNVGVDNLGWNETIFRLDDNLMLDQTAMCLKGFVTVAVNNQRGNRMFCLVEPLIDGSPVSDGTGRCTAIFAFTPTSANYTGNVKFAIPYQWSGMNMNSNLQNVESFQLRITVVDFNKENPIVASEDVTIDQSRINIDRDKVVQGGLSGIFGGSGTGNIGTDMIATMFGGGDTITHKCTSCDGVGLCPYCDGDGFIDPSICNKCASNPGVCRRCGGKGKETSEVEINTGFW